MIRYPGSTIGEVQCLLGDLKAIEDAPEQLFHPLRIDFLAELSRALMADASAKGFPDVVTFAFWCRRANLEALAKSYDRDSLRIGLGLVFHISPSNVPINFAYSLVFAFLSGNSSVVRLPSREAPQTDLLIRVLGEVLSLDKFRDLRSAVHLVRYNRADPITEFWLQHSLGRIVWGGDATVAHIRSLKVHPRSREVAFVDRYSLSAIAAQSVLDADQDCLRKLCVGIYNDHYLMDQYACSSPQLLVWVGSAEEVAEAQSRLWPEVIAVARQKYILEPVQAMDKYVALCSEVIEHKNIGQVRQDSPQLTRIGLKKLTENQWAQRGHFGTVHEYTVDSLDAIAPVVDSRFQTLTTFGFGHQLLRDFITSNRLAGIDRVVPIGRALDMGVLWDGFDVLATLTRVIDVQS